MKTRTICKFAYAVTGITWLFLAPVSSPASESQSKLEAVARVATVTVWEADGRIGRFVDNRDREFAVKYSEDRRVSSIESTRGPNMLDIVFVAYAASGKLAAVRYRTGYSLFFDHRPDGSTVIRDTRGGSLLKIGSAIRAIDGAGAKATADLADTADRIETLVGAMTASSRS